MAGDTNDISGQVAVTGLTVIKIHLGCTGVQAAIGPVRPACIAVVVRHDHFHLMAVVTKRQIAMAGNTVFFVGPGIDAMIVTVVKRMGLPVKVIAFVAFHTIVIGMAVPAVILLDLPGNAMIFFPVGQVVLRAESHILIMTGIAHFLLLVKICLSMTIHALITARNIGTHGRLFLLRYTLMAVQTGFSGGEMGLM